MPPRITITNYFTNGEDEKILKEISMSGRLLIYLYTPEVISNLENVFQSKYAERIENENNP